jgi:hypothetical protein
VSAPRCTHRNHPRDGALRARRSRVSDRYAENVSTSHRDRSHGISGGRPRCRDPPGPPRRPRTPPGSPVAAAGGYCEAVRSSGGGLVRARIWAKGRSPRSCSMPRSSTARFGPPSTARQRPPWDAVVWIAEAPPRRFP